MAFQNDESDKSATTKIQKYVQIQFREIRRWNEPAHLPSMTWLATGGKNGCLSGEALEVLKGRKVMLVPDLGATEYWQSKLPLLEAQGIDATILNHLEENATDKQRADGYDIADFLLDGNSPQVILQKMIAKNPALKTLIEKLDLELVGTEKHLE